MRVTRESDGVRVLIAPDSFGGTLSSPEAAAAIAEGWSSAAPRDELDLAPLSDGGPGFVDVLAEALGGRLVPVDVAGPLGTPVRASLLRVGDTAYVETAAAAGLALLTPAERDPRVTTSAGVGELVVAALDGGASRVVLGLGGSATNDGGAGMLAALGLGLLDAAERVLAPGGAALARLDRLDPAGVDPRSADVELVAATDVDSPLLGPDGASASFGPQKGAGADGVAELEAALSRWAAVVTRDLRPPPPAGWETAPGAGAAGGLGGALLALGARRESGIALVLECTRLAERVAAADLVVTGEGSFDWSSLRGKVVSGVAAAAREEALACLVLAGAVSVGRREAAAAGVEAAYAVVDEPGGLQAALDRPAVQLRALAARVAREWSR
jgi:glycerate 2-kinase